MLLAKAYLAWVMRQGVEDLKIVNRLVHGFLAQCLDTIRLYAHAMLWYRPMLLSPPTTFDYLR